MCRDGHICQRACSHTQPRDPVHSLNVEGVASEHCKVQYCYRGASNAEWPWDKVQVRLARLTLCHSTAAVTPTTALAQYVVSDVLSASCITGRHPLQEESCVIDEWDQVPGSWWRPWKREEKYLETDIFFFFWRLHLPLFEMDILQDTYATLNMKQWLAHDHHNLTSLHAEHIFIP